jgi:hypothetical protein
MEVKQMKHTPGPWEVKDNWIIGYPEANIAIAKLMGNVGQPVEANASLIAAAPDMAQMLYLVRNHIDTMSKAYETNGHGSCHVLKAIDAILNRINDVK